MSVPERVSLRELARRLDLKSDNAVRRAVAAGRLAGSVGYDKRGTPFVRDVALAIREFNDSSSRPRAEACAVSPEPLEPPEPLTPVAGERARIISAATLTEAQRLATIERARKLRMENDLREGRLIEVAKSARVAFEAERTIRESVLNIPARLAAELAGESDAVRLHIRLDAALRDALQIAAGTIVTAVNE